jgi:hypothetical protein
MPIPDGQEVGRLIQVPQENGDIVSPPAKLATPLTLEDPLISRVAHGVVVPIPTLVQV